MAPPHHPPRSPQPPLRSAPARAARAARAGGVVMTLVVAVALLATTGGSATAGLPVEDFPAHDPQRTCSPAPKKGTLMLAAWLQRTYRGSGSSGISRSCGASGTSEHKEGRAFDWRLDVRSARDRGYAASFLERVRSTDRAGNVAALGRRMGIMYLIWDDRIYSASHAYAPRPYRHAACRRLRGCSATLRHRDHVHISLSWSGARARTSWYARRATPPAPNPPAPNPPAPTTPTPAPVPQPPASPALLELGRTEVALTTLPAGATRQTRFALSKGRTYRLSVYGVTRYGSAPSQVADAVCSWVPGRGWRAGIDPATQAEYGGLDLRVNGARPFGSTCRAGRHLYQVRYRPRRTGPLTLHLDQPAAVGGALVVAVSRGSHRIGAQVPAPPAAVPAPRAVVPEPAPAGGAVRTSAVVRGASAQAWTGQRLEAGVSYRVSVTGTLEVAAGVWTDGQCTSLDGPAGRWWPQASAHRYDPGADHGNLFLDGAPLAGSAPPEDPDGCSAHRHTTVLTPATGRRLHLQVWDPTPGAGDNRGELRVVVDRLTRLPAAPVGRTLAPDRSRRWQRPEEELLVRASAEATPTSMRLRRGERVEVRVGGVVRDGDGLRADAACVHTGEGWATGLGSPTGQDVLGLHVDGRSPTWRTIEGRPGCSQRHAYVTTVTASHHGPLALAFLDADHADNIGRVRVRLVRR